MPLYSGTAAGLTRSTANLEDDMGELNLSREEREALNAIDTAVLRERIEQALVDKCASSLSNLRLDRCGQYPSAELRAFERALRDFGAAKAAKKYAETEYRARRAGDDLEFAIKRMKDRAETEEKEGQLFLVDDHFFQPINLREHMTVSVSYRWRPTIDDAWKFGNITFTHDMEFRPDYTTPPPRRKPSARKQEQDRQERLFREWEHLMKLALHSVHFFRKGGNAEDIPKTFRAKVDQSRSLNNFSTNFWMS